MSEPARLGAPDVARREPHSGPGRPVARASRAGLHQRRPPQLRRQRPLHPGHPVSLRRPVTRKCPAASSCQAARSPRGRALSFLTAGFQLANTLSFCRRQPTTLKKTLQCLEGIHLSQSGAVLTLYVDKLLRTPFRALARMVDTLACRRVEMLLAANLQVLKKTLILVFIENLAKQAK